MNDNLKRKADAFSDFMEAVSIDGVDAHRDEAREDSPEEMKAVKLAYLQMLDAIARNFAEIENANRTGPRRPIDESVKKKLEETLKFIDSIAPKEQSKETRTQLGIARRSIEDAIERDDDDAVLGAVFTAGLYLGPSWFRMLTRTKNSIGKIFDSSLAANMIDRKMKAGAKFGEARLAVADELDVPENTLRKHVTKKNLEDLL